MRVAYVAPKDNKLAAFDLATGSGHLRPNLHLYRPAAGPAFLLERLRLRELSYLQVFPASSPVETANVIRTHTDAG